MLNSNHCSPTKQKESNQLYAMHRHTLNMNDNTFWNLLSSAAEDALDAKTLQLALKARADVTPPLAPGIDSRLCYKCSFDS